MARSLHVFAVAAAALAAMEISAGAGDKGTHEGKRLEFQLSEDYPYIFRPAGYLQKDGPAPMRYGEPAIDCSHRRAPALPAAAKGTEPEQPKAEKSAAPQASPSPLPTPTPTPAPDAKISSDQTESVSSVPAYPAPVNGQAPIPKGSADFSKAPDEVVGYFRNPYNFVPDSHRFFDPIFEPAQAAQGAQQGPKSSATYHETP